MQITKENLTIILVTIKSHNIIDQCLESIDPNVKKVVIENLKNIFATMDSIALNNIILPIGAKNLVESLL